MEDRPRSTSKLAFTSYVLVVWPIAGLVLLGLYWRLSLDWPVLETPGVGYGVFVAAAIAGVISIVVGALMGLWNRDHPSSEYAWMAIVISVLGLSIYLTWHLLILPSYARL